MNGPKIGSEHTLWSSGAEQSKHIPAIARHPGKLCAVAQLSGASTGRAKKNTTTHHFFAQPSLSQTMTPRWDLGSRVELVEHDWQALRVELKNSVDTQLADAEVTIGRAVVLDETDGAVDVVGWMSTAGFEGVEDVAVE